MERGAVPSAELGTTDEAIAAIGLLNLGRNDHDKCIFDGYNVEDAHAVNFTGALEPARQL